MMRARSSARKLDLRSVELRSLIELSQVLNASLDADAVLNTCLLTPMGRMLISRGMALTADENGSLGVRILKGLPASLAQQRFTFEYAFRTPTRLAELPDDVCRYKPFLQSLGIELVVPMCSPSRMVGALCFGGKMTGKPFSPRELEFLNSFSNIAATALENALMFQSLITVNRRLDRKVHELNTLFEVGKELNTALDRERILAILQHTVMGQMTVNKLIMIEVGEDQTIEYPILKWPERTELDRILAEKELILSLSELNEARLLTAEEPAHRLLFEAGVRAVVPMRLQEETRALLLLGKRLSRQEYAQEDLDFLSTLGNRVMVSLENVRLFQEALEKQRLEEEMAIAESIQQRLLPRTFPSLHGIEIYGLNQPSRMVGGDYFDCIPLSDGRVVLAVGDVSGKGLGAALLMSNLHAGLHTLLQSGLPMNEMIKRLNDLIYRH
ncbi:MAG: GAF domain-containing protein, partial [candidate division KSB1 bacterium]|nr:GAF domain-containing protein [candidate division KSB1 bacterium]